MGPKKKKSTSVLSPAAGGTSHRSGSSTLSSSIDNNANPFIAGSPLSTTTPSSTTDPISSSTPTSVPITPHHPNRFNVNTGPSSPSPTSPSPSPAPSRSSSATPTTHASVSSSSILESRIMGGASATRSSPQQPLIVEGLHGSSDSDHTENVNVNMTRYKHMLRIILNPNDMVARRFKIGEVVVVEKMGSDEIGKSEKDQSRIQINPVMRLNAGIALGSRITLQRLTRPILEASKLVLKPTAPVEFALDDALMMFAHEILIDIKYIVEGGIVEFQYCNKRRQFRVERARAVVRMESRINQQPDNTMTATHENTPPLRRVFEVTRTTKVSFVPYSQESKKKWGSAIPVGYDSIGGLAKEVSVVRRMVEVTLKDPKRFTQYGLRPPRGVLLYGPPGTGKTLIARAVAAETGAHVIIINGPEIISKFYGETEERLRSIFEEAEENAPSIIFIDEIDSLCPKRDESNSDLEKRIVATLLILMDGADSKSNNLGGVVVMAATNRPNMLDEALRRPGRFDREIEIGIPDPSDRLSILKSHLSRIPHSLTEEQIFNIAAVTHGYVGADLAAVCREAGLKAVKRLAGEAERLGLKKGCVDGLDVRVNCDEMMQAMGEIKPSSMREILLEVPRVLWTDIGGQDDIKQKLKEAVEWPLKHPEAFARFKIRPPKGILLYGPPGCSKTLMAKALATEAGLNFLAVKGPELFSKWVGESEKAVRDIFKKARAASPSIVFFDEIDAIAVRRGGDEGSVGDRVLSQLLNEMDGIEPLVNVTVVAATNRPDIIDSALLRPGRIDRILYVSPPDFASRLQIFKIRVGKMATGADVDIEELTRLTDGFSGAEVVAVCQEAAMKAMEEDVLATEVKRIHFLQAIKGVTPRISKEMIAFYDEFRTRSGLRAI
ncbi:spermatogenesis associated protein 5 [Blyttiomyces sp. JEL0837]|nr:spermatogenesis associated protein 5 [Blyttiomyces sp. JEL0837]